MKKIEDIKNFKSKRNIGNCIDNKVSDFEETFGKFTLHSIQIIT